MDARGRRSQPPTLQTQTLIAEVVADMTSQLDTASAMVADAIHDACGEELRGDLYSSTQRSTRANLGLITTLIADQGSPTRFDAPAEALAYARSYVHEGLSFDLLIRAYREGEHAYSRLWMQALHSRARDVDELVDSMRYIEDWLFEYIGAMNPHLSSAYATEHARWVQGGAARRADEVRRILAGTEVDLDHASQQLRYRLAERHLGFVIWGADSGQDVEGLAPSQLAGADADRLALQVIEQLDGSGALLVALGNVYAGWVAVGADPDLSSLPRTAGSLHLAVGRPAAGLDGFRRTHAEALLARRVASLAERAPLSAVPFENVALDSLLTHDLDEARRFVARELGPLADDSDASRRLAATLEVFLQEESSFVRAARRLGVHENTIAYRIRRIEELLGHRTSERQLELRTALRIAAFVDV